MRKVPEDAGKREHQRYHANDGGAGWSVELIGRPESDQAGAATDHGGHNRH